MGSIFEEKSAGEGSSSKRRARSDESIGFEVEVDYDSGLCQIEVERLLHVYP